MAIRKKRNYWPLVGVVAVMFLIYQAGFSHKQSLEPVKEAVRQKPFSTYREDELALLRIATDDILELERKKQYGKIYDQYGSERFKATTPRRDFMKMANCVERTLGGVVEYDPTDLGFRRKQTKKHVYDSITRSIIRSETVVQEKFTFVMEGMSYKLQGVYWSTPRKEFLLCAQSVFNPPAAADDPSAVKPDEVGATAGSVTPSDAPQSAGTATVKKSETGTAEPPSSTPGGRKTGKHNASISSAETPKNDQQHPSDPEKPATTEDSENKTPKPPPSDNSPNQPAAEKPSASDNTKPVVD